jgi:hypothetical protein
MVLVFAALRQSVGTAMVVRGQHLTTVRRIDLWCRKLFPMLLAVIVRKVRVPSAYLGAQRAVPPAARSVV